MKPKDCTLVIGRCVYVRKHCEGMILATAGRQVRGYAKDVKAVLEKHLPADVTLTMEKNPRLMGFSNVEMSIVALKDGKHYPAYHWVSHEIWKDLENHYSVRSQ